MARPIKDKPLSCNEIIEAEKNRKSPKIYKAESMGISDERISVTTQNVLNSLSNIEDKKQITLADTPRVKEKTKEYFQACIQASSFPSMTGLARAIGYSRRGVYKFINTNPNHATSKWLELCQDAFSDILSENALRGNVNPVYAIFNQKAMYGMQDKTSIEINGNAHDPLQDFPSANGQPLTKEDYDKYLILGDTEVDPQYLPK